MRARKQIPPHTKSSTLKKGEYHGLFVRKTLYLLSAVKNKSIKLCLVEGSKTPFSPIFYEYFSIVN